MSISLNTYPQATPCEDIGINNSLNFITSTSPATINPGTEFCVEFNVENFTSINTFQFTLNFDPTLLDFVSFTDNQAALGDPILPNLMQVDNGILPLVWFNFATTGLSVPDGTLAFTICFRASSQPSDCASLAFTNALAPIFPATEINYQLSEAEKCQDSIIFINGAMSTCFEINCTTLSIADLQVCNSNSNQGSVNFSACGGVAPYTYTIETTNNIVLLSGMLTNDYDYPLVPPMNMPAMTYILRIIDATGMSVTRPIIIDAIEPVSYDPLEVVQPICSNISNGSIAISNITSGLPGELFDVSFSNGITYQDVTEALFQRLLNGNYSITITDTNGCETEEDIVLFTPPLEIDIDITPATCFGSEDGAISAIASGGTPFNGNEYSYNNIIQETFETFTPYQDNAFNNITNRYRLRVSDSNGCSLEENIEIPNVMEIEVEIVDVTDNICKGDCEGSLTLNVLTPGRFTFLVRDQNNDFLTLGGNNGQSLFYNNELCAGRYSVLVRDTSGCSKDTFFVINEPDEELSTETDFIQASCNSNDGQAIVNVSGGMMPYTFVWEADPTDTDNILEEVLPAIYNVQITDDLGCAIDTFVEVLSGNELEIEAFIINNLECDGSGTGQLSVNITNSSVANHSFLWMDENNVALGTTQILNFINPGTYIIQVDAIGNNCEALDTIFIDNTPGLILEIATTNATCEQAFNGSIEIQNISGGVGPYECIWEDQSVVSCNPIGLMAGTYNLTISDSEGCSKDTFVVLDADQTDILFDIISTLPSCSGENDGVINLVNIQGGVGPYECIWEDQSVVSCNPNNLSAGTYNFAVQDANGCVKDTFVVINEGVSTITYDLDINNPECGGSLGSIEVLNLDGSNLPIDISWSVIGAVGNQATDLNIGDVTISFEDSRGCRSDTTITLISVATDFQLDIDANLPDCAVGLNNGTISFPGFDSANGVCLWDDPSLNAQNCTLIGLAPGIYNLTLTDGNGCQKDTFVDLTVADRLEIEITDIIDVTCFGADDGQATASVINNPSGAGSLNFFWTNPLDDGTGLSDNALQLSPGFNTVYAFDGLCTSDTLDFTINEPLAIQIDDATTILDDVKCASECNGSASLQAFGGTLLNNEDYRFLWEDGFTGELRNNLCEGVYLLTITDSNNCSFVDSIIINEPDLLTLAIDSSLIQLISCGNDNTGSLTVVATDGCGNYSYEWRDNVSTSATASNLPVGLYEVTVTDDCGCSSTTSFEFDAAVPLVAEAMVPEIPQCQGDQVCIGIESVSGGTGINYTFSINFGARIPIDSCVLVDPGSYTLLVFDSAGCSTQLSVSVEQPGEFSVNIGGDILLDLGDNETMVIATTTGGNPLFSYEWISEAQVDCFTAECESVIVNPFAFTSLEVIVTDDNGCIAQDEINIEIKTDRNIYIPNVFEPDFLPPNNKFMILTGRGVAAIESFRIFDRWGNLVYEEENIPAPTSTDQGWDGRRGDTGNNKVEQGVYVYTAKVRFVDDVVLNYRGQITLIR